MMDNSPGRLFGAAASEYDRLRPPLPDAAVDWLVPREVHSAVDLGAGSGAFTRELAGRVGTVYALEPDGRFHAALRRNCPGAVVLAGLSEAMPLHDGAVDAVFAAGAWHWFDPDAAAAEAARVLRTGGVLAVAWNDHDTRVPWMAELRDLIGLADPTATGRIGRFDLPAEAPFSRPEHLDLPNVHPMTAETVVQMMATYSPVLALPPNERDDLLRRVAGFLATHPRLSGRKTIDVPMLAMCRRATRT